MQTPTEQEIRGVAALIRAERRARRRRPLLSPGAPPMKVADRKRAEQPLMALFERAGIGREELARFRADRLAELHRLRDDERVPPTNRTARGAAAATAALASRREAAEHLARRQRAAGEAWKLVVLDAPFLVLPSSDISLDAVTIKPENTVARAHGTWQSSNPDNDADAVEYWFFWKNPSDAEVLVNVWSIMSLDGFMDALAAPGSDSTWAGVSVGLTLLEWWHQPPTLPMYQTSQYNSDPGTFYLTGGGPFGVGEYASTIVSGSYDVSYSQFLIPANGVAVFQVGLSVVHDFYPPNENVGFVDVDFSSDGRQMMCPAILLSVLT